MLHIIILCISLSIPTISLTSDCGSACIQSLISFLTTSSQTQIRKDPVLATAHRIKNQAQIATQAEGNLTTTDTQLPEAILVSSQTHATSDQTRRSRLQELPAINLESLNRKLNNHVFCK